MDRSPRASLHQHASSIEPDAGSVARISRSAVSPVRRVLAAVAALVTAAALTVVAAPAASAAPGTGNRVFIGDHNDIVVAECADGGSVMGPLIGYASFHERVDRDGNVISLSIAMEYKMTWTLSTTGESVYPHGTRRLLFDFDAGTITDTGNYRKLTLAGEGAVLNYAGISIYDLATDKTLYHRGPAVSDTTPDDPASNDLVCGLFGVDGA